MKVCDLVLLLSFVVVAFCLQGGYMKRMFSCGWAVWTFNASSARVYTGEALWHKQTERTQDALERLSAAEADLGAQLAEVES